MQIYYVKRKRLRVYRGFHNFTKWNLEIWSKFGFGSACQVIKTVLDSRFHAVDIRIPDSLSVELGFRIPCSELRLPYPTIPDSASKNFPDLGSELPYMGWCMSPNSDENRLKKGKQKKSELQMWFKPRTLRVLDRMFEHGGSWVRIPSGAHIFYVVFLSLILYISLYFLYNTNISVVIGWKETDLFLLQIKSLTNKFRSVFLEIMQRKKRKLR